MNNVELSAFPVITELRLSWGQMDAFQHVNNIVYFRYFEHVRLDYFARISFGGMMNEEGLGPILASVNCNFRFPLTFPDTVFVGTRVTRLGQHSFTMAYALFSQRFQRLAADGDSVIVSYDYRAERKAPLPEAWRAAIIRTETTVDPAAAQRLAARKEQ